MCQEVCGTGFTVVAERERHVVASPNGLGKVAVDGGDPSPKLHSWVSGPASGS